MKKSVSFLSLALLSVFNLHAQENTEVNSETKFGLKAGYSTLSVRATYNGSSASENASGFYIGALTDIYLSESFNLQPELTYARYSEDGSSSEVLLIPVLLKYKPAAEFGILAGPQLDYLLNEEDGEGTNRLGFGMALGFSYDITENVIIDARYTFGISNRLEDNEFVDLGVKVMLNYFQVGLAYKF